MKRAIAVALVVGLAARADPSPLPDGGVDCDTPTKFDVYPVDFGRITSEGRELEIDGGVYHPHLTAVCGARRVLACETENKVLKGGPPPEFVKTAVELVAVTALLAFAAGVAAGKLTK